MTSRVTRIGVGVIGCGYWGPNLVRVLHETEGAEVVRVSDLRSGRREFVQKRFPTVETTGDARDIISDPRIDAVVIATRPETHFPLAMEALKAGKHTFVEKPLALTLREAETIVEKAAQLRKSLAVGHLFLYAPAVVAIRTLLQKRELGDIYYVSSTRANPGPPNPQIDALWDLAPHDISIVLDIMGEPPESVEAQGCWFTNPALAETVFLTMRFSANRVAHIHVSWLIPNRIRLLQLICSQRVAVYDDTQPLQKLQVLERGADNRLNCGDGDSHQLSYGVGSVWIPGLPSTEPLRAECEDFIRSIADGAQPYSSGVKGLEVVRVLERASQELAHQTPSRHAETASRILMEGSDA